MERKNKKIQLEWMLGVTLVLSFEIGRAPTVSPSSSLKKVRYGNSSSYTWFSDPRNLCISTPLFIVGQLSSRDGKAKQRLFLRDFHK